MEAVRVIHSCLLPLFPTWIDGHAYTVRLGLIPGRKTTYGASDYIVIFLVQGTRKPLGRVLSSSRPCVRSPWVSYPVAKPSFESHSAFISWVTWGGDGPSNIELLHP